ncbi:hypothetical protein [Maribellus mangrovi]|uniref:hypothetical protein n=1 Tax=Maribellus mangrovi TaxID=3133146 RepID=UPI0030EB6E3D
MRRSIAILLVFFSLAGMSQNTETLELLKNIESIKQPDFAAVDSNQFLSFKLSPPEMLNFNQENKTGAKNKFSTGIFRSPYDNMPILGYGNALPGWNMPIAVPDSSVEYFIKNPMLLHRPTPGMKK